ncbi:unnamed protein product [Peniophora sp. CBMAI 1063]|nr:unnamed protein product [Peniophora sp. CBMAI 1063]
MKSVLERLLRLNRGLAAQRAAIADGRLKAAEHRANIKNNYESLKETHAEVRDLEESFDEESETMVSSMNTFFDDVQTLIRTEMLETDERHERLLRSIEEAGVMPQTVA